MLVLSVASLASVEDVVDDRAAVEVGAQSVHRLGSSWHVDPTAPTQAPQPPDGIPLPPAAIPAGRNPALPPGQSVVWRTQTTVAASSASVHLMVIDPARLPGSADWGSAGGPVGLGRAMLPALAAQDAEAAATIRRNGVTSEVPGLLVGSLEDLDLEVGSTLTVDTLGNPVRVVVRGVLDAFPGAKTGRPTLVLAADSFFANQFNDDPRLRPAPGVRRNQPIEFQADLWSRSAAAAVATLTRFEVPVEPVASLAQARTVPVYVASAQARRYQVALGAVFGLLGLAAVVLAGVRLARRAPAADLMVAWTGAASRAPARARALEVAAVLVLTCVLSVAGLLALRPLASTLLEPGDGRTPPATLTVPAAAWALGLAWVAAAALATLLGMRWAATSQSAVEVLRGEE
jgi:hypothetical protein